MTKDIADTVAFIRKEKAALLAIRPELEDLASDLAKGAVAMSKAGGELNKAQVSPGFASSLEKMAKTLEDSANNTRVAITKIDRIITAPLPAWMVMQSGEGGTA